MTITERLKEFINHLGVKTLEFEKECGITESLISKAIKNNTGFNATVLNQIKDRYPELDLNWLMTGNGLMIDYAELRRLKDKQELDKTIAEMQEAIRKINANNAKILNNPTADRKERNKG